jgi:hypothetical protein
MLGLLFGPEDGGNTTQHYNPEDLLPSNLKEAEECE